VARSLPSEADCAPASLQALFVLDKFEAFPDVKHMITKAFVSTLFLSALLSLISAGYAADPAEYTGLEAAKPAPSPTRLKLPFRQRAEIFF
jgi:hypothetical protein